MGREIEVNTLEEMCDLMCGTPEDEPQTRFELLTEMSIVDAAMTICTYISDKIEDCDYCPFTNRCRQGHNGVLDYLKEEV